MATRQTVVECNRDRGKARKRFFLKKKQKLLLLVPRTDGAEYALCWVKSQKFFGSFFQKRTASLAWSGLISPRQPP
jgi:hypothetical protein